MPPDQGRPSVIVMIELDHRAGYAYPAPVVFQAVADVAEYPAWQPDVSAARVYGGGSPCLGAQVAQVRNMLGRSTYLDFTVHAYEPGRVLELRTVAAARSQFAQAFRVEQGLVAGCCHLTVTVRLDGVPALAEELSRAVLTYQLIQALDCLRMHLSGRPAAVPR